MLRSRQPRVTWLQGESTTADICGTAGLLPSLFPWCPHHQFLRGIHLSSTAWMGSSNQSRQPVQVRQAHGHTRPSPGKLTPDNENTKQQEHTHPTVSRGQHISIPMSRVPRQPWLLPTTACGSVFLPDCELLHPFTDPRRSLERKMWC